MAINTNFPNVRPSLLLDFANAQQLDPRVTFSRSTTAPYYDGKTSVLAEQNLILQSNGFSTSTGWQQSGNGCGVPVQNATAPDGTTTAWTLTATAGNSIHIMQQTGYTTVSASTNYVVSFYLQAGTNTYASIGVLASITNYTVVNFTLSGAGTAGSITSAGTVTGVTATITQFGSWYRCSLSFNTTATQVNSYVQISNSATPTYGSGGFITYNAAGTETLLVYGAQLEQRSSVTAYNATTTTAITNYIPQLLTAPINQPRFDFNPTTGESLGLLIEQSSTCLLYTSDAADE